MRRIFTRPSVAVEADLTQLNVTAALNKEIEQIKENREPTLVKKDEEKSNEDSIGNGTAEASGDNGTDNGGSETQANDSSDSGSSGSSGESAEDVSINADVDEGLDEEFIAEALSICEDGKKISNSYSYEAYKAFKARSNALINSINGVVGLEEIRDDYVIDSEALAQEDIASTLKAIGQKIIEIIKAIISFGQSYVNLIKSDIHAFNKRYDDLMESLDIVKDSSESKLGEARYQIMLPAGAAPSVATLMQGGKLIYGMLDSYFNHFKMNFPQFSISANKLVDDFTHLRATSGTIYLKAETRPSILRSVKMVPALKAPEEDMTAWMSADATDSVFMAAWIGKDSVINLGESNAIFSSTIKLTRADYGSDAEDKEYPLLKVDELKKLMGVIKACIGRLSYAETSMAVAVEDLKKFEKKVEYFSNVKIAEGTPDADTMQERVNQIQSVVSKMIGLYKSFYITPTKNVCSYGKHYITTSFSFVAASIKKHDSAD